VNHELTHSSVMRGLDPRIHPFSMASFVLTDCRVKPGSDDGVVA
jgi:hypothetical protein